MGCVCQASAMESGSAGPADATLATALAADDEALAAMCPGANDAAAVMLMQLNLKHFEQEVGIMAEGVSLAD